MKFFSFLAMDRIWEIIEREVVCKTKGSPQEYYFQFDSRQVKADMDCKKGVFTLTVFFHWHGMSQGSWNTLWGKKSKVSEEQTRAKKLFDRLDPHIAKLDGFQSSSVHCSKICCLSDHATYTALFTPVGDFDRWGAY